MLIKFRIPDEVWNDFTNKTEQPSETIRNLIIEYINGKNTLDNIMGVNEASELWDLTPAYIKNLCAQGKIQAVKIGKTWIILREQKNPSKK